MIRIFPKQSRVNIVDTYVYMNSVHPQFIKQTPYYTNAPSYTFVEHPIQRNRRGIIPLLDFETIF